MFRYEVLMLTIPEITKDEAATIESHLEKLVSQAKGSMLSFERWGKYKLAFPIRKNEYGIYTLARFEIPTKSNLLEEIKNLLAVRFEGTIMRFVITALDASKPLTYQRPLSLEEAPAKSATSFLKEKGLMGEDRGEKRSRQFEDMDQEHEMEA